MPITNASVSFKFSTLETDYILDPLALNDLQLLAPIFSQSGY